jgi:hypothetical protein
MVRVEFCPGVNSHMVLVLAHRLLGLTMQTIHPFASSEFHVTRVGPDLFTAGVNEAYWISLSTTTRSEINSSHVDWVVSRDQLCPIVVTIPWLSSCAGRLVTREWTLRRTDQKLIVPTSSSSRTTSLAIP